MSGAFGTGWVWEDGWGSDCDACMVLRRRDCSGRYLKDLMLMDGDDGDDGDDERVGV